MNRQTVSIVLCADDYGISASANQAILRLVQAGRLSATSCMVETPDWTEAAKALREVSAQIDIGLHFNLTHGFGHSPDHPLGPILARSLLHRVDRQAMAATLQAQMERFVAGMGREPDFIDGHQHVHMFPVIRDLFLDACERQFGKRPYIRNPLPSAGASESLKGWVLHTLARGFGKRLVKRGFTSNPAFMGMYSLRPDEDYPALMRGWLRQATNGTLIMCHPAVQAEADDSIGPTRVREYAYLSSEQFSEDCESAGVTLQRFRACHNQG